LRVVSWIEIAQVVPAGAGPLRHRVGLALGGAAALGALAIYPIGRPRQRWLSVIGGGEITDFGKAKWQFAFREWDGAAPAAMDDGYRFAPITLAAEEPIAQLVIDCSFAKAF